MARWIPSPNFLPGSTDVGSQDSDTHKFTGSVGITGSLTVNGVSITGGGGGGSGDVTGPGSSTDNAIARYDLATGKIIQNSGVTIDDSNNIDGAITITTIDVSASSNISASSFYGSADNLSASYTAHDTNNPILTKLDATGKINAENYLSYEYASGHSYLYLASSAPSRRPHLIFEHGIPGTADDNRTQLYSNATIANDPFYIARRTTNIYYPISIWQNTLDQSHDKVGINIPYGEEAAYRFDVSGSSRFQEDVTFMAGINPQGSAGDSIQIGSNNGAVAIGSLNISFGGTVLGQGSQAIGPGSPQAIAAGASAIGSGSNAIATNSMALGTLASASATNAIAVGTSATGSGTSTVAIGNTAIAGGASSTAIGNAATASAPGAIAMGSGATTAGDYSIVLGDTITNVTHNHTTVIGSRASVGGANAVAIGSGSNASAANAIAIGQSAAPSAADTIAIGQGAAPSATGSVAIGAGSTTTGQQSVVLGPTNSSTANYTTVVGYNNNASVNYSIIIGDTSVASAANAVAVGQNVLASGADSIAIGQFATASAANTIAIGSGSNAARANTAVFGNSTVPMRLYVTGGFAQTNFYHGAAHVNGSQQLAAGTYNIFDVRYDGATQITASNLVAGASYLIFLSNSVGTAAVTYDPTTFKFPGGTVPTVTQTQGAIDIVSGISDGTAIYCDMTKNFS